MEEHLELRPRAHQEECPFCHDVLVAEVETWACDRCGTRLHAECFRENQLRCTVLGCQGRARVPPGARHHTRSLTPEEVEARELRRARLARDRAAEGPSAVRPRTARRPTPVPLDATVLQGPVGLLVILGAPILFGLLGNAAGAFPLFLAVGMAISFVWVVLIAIFGKPAG